MVQDLSYRIMDVDERIAQINARLKVARVRATIERRGNKLWLRGTLPPKPRNEQTKPYRQKLALGVNATMAGIQEAEKRAKLLSAQLDAKEFRWEDWSEVGGTEEEKPETVEQALKRFEEKFKPDMKPITWKTDYYNVFKWLDTEKDLTIDLLEEVLDQTKAHTRTRRRFSLALGKSAESAGLKNNFKSMRGKYSASEVEPRDLPNDEKIVEGFHSINNPGWRWVYGMLATYGLRNHEVFYLDTTDLGAGQSPEIFVREGKTGKRLVWPCYPEWVDEFGLRKKCLPNVTGKEHKDYGQRVTKFFGRTFDFTALDLRHRWAIRTLEFNWPYALAAMQMGHSVKEHERTYHRSITAETHRKVFNLLVLKSDRPRH